MNGNFIKEWSFANEAALKLKIEQGNIFIACKGIRKTVGGFKWKLKT